MCDLAEVLNLERLERVILADRQGFLARGVAYDALPSVEQAQDRWRAELVAAPQAIDLLTYKRLKAVGLA